MLPGYDGNTGKGTTVIELISSNNSDEELVYLC